MFNRLITRDIDNRFTLNYNKKYNNILDDPNSELGIFINRIIVVLVIVSVLILVVESISDFGIVYKKGLFITDFVISSIFLFEYIYRFSRSKFKFDFVRHPLNIIDLLAFLPFFLGILFTGIISAEYLKVLRLLRVFRILKLTKHLPVIVGFLRALKDYRSEYRAVFILFLIILTVVSVFVYNAENKMNPEMFGSIPDAFWWALVTMTTVGYGDAYPITPLGKVIGSILILFGPVLLAVLSSITILVFMDVVEVQRRKITNYIGKQCKRCKTQNSKIANYCINCGKDLLKEKKKDKK